MSTKQSETPQDLISMSNKMYLANDKKRVNCSNMSALLLILGEKHLEKRAYNLYLWEVYWVRTLVYVA